jgi:hypothetical protein
MDSENEVVSKAIILQITAETQAGKNGQIYHLQAGVN